MRRKQWVLVWMLLVRAGVVDDGRMETQTETEARTKLSPWTGGTGSTQRRNLERSGLTSAAVCHRCLWAKPSAQSRAALTSFALAVRPPLPGPRRSSPVFLAPHPTPPPGRLGACAHARAVCRSGLQGWILQVRTQKRGRQSGIAQAEIWGSGFRYGAPVRFQALG